MSDTCARIRIARTSTVAIAGFCMATALAVSPAGAEAPAGSSNESATTVNQVSESISDELDSGSFEISAPENAEFTTDDAGAVTLVASSGDSAALSSEITVDGRTYFGEWSVNGGIATFAVTSMQNASSGAGSVSEVQSEPGYAECVVQSTSEATIVAAVVGIATGPGQTAVIPITMVASLTVFGISCAY